MQRRNVLRGLQAFSVASFMCGSYTCVRSFETRDMQERVNYGAAGYILTAITGAMLYAYASSRKNDLK